MRAAMLVLLTACWTTASPAPVVPDPAVTATAPGTIRFRAKTRSDCARILGSTVERLRAEIASAGMPEPTLDEMLGAAIESCEVTQWSAELLGCYDALGAANDLLACQAMMSPEQSEDLTRRMMDIVSLMNGPAAHTPP